MPESAGDQRHICHEGPPTQALIETIDKAGYHVLVGVDSDGLHVVEAICDAGFDARREAR